MAASICKSAEISNTLHAQSSECLYSYFNKNLFNVPIILIFFTFCNLVFLISPTLFSVCYSDLGLSKPFQNTLVFQDFCHWSIFSSSKNFKLPWIKPMWAEYLLILGHAKSFITSVLLTLNSAQWSM